MNAAILDKGFTSSDWFQLLYPIVFVLGEEVGRRRAIRRSVATHQVPRISLVQVLVWLPSPREQRRPRSQQKPSRSTSTSGDEGLVLVLGGLASLLLAWLFLHGRGAALALAAILVALTLGALIGRICGQIQSHRFAADWWTATITWLALSAAAIVCELAILSPPAAPDAYDALFGGFRREGISILDLFDGTVQFIAYQAIGMLALVMATALLLFSVVSVLTKEALFGGASPTRWRRLLANGARTRSSVRAVLAIVGLLLTGSFLFGSGYAYSLVDANVTGAARIVAPAAVLNGRRLDVDFVTDRRSRVRVTVQHRARTRPWGLWTLSLRPGRHHVVRWLPGRASTRAVVTLTPLDAHGDVGTRRTVRARRTAPA